MAKRPNKTDAKKAGKYAAPQRREGAKPSARSPMEKRAAKPVPQKQAAVPAADTAAAEALQQLRAVISDPRPTVAVVGGGAAGLAAAITAAKTAPQVRVLLLENAPRVGRKLLATGNGRCNLTNEILSAADYVSSEPAVLETFLAGHSSAATEEWFRAMGLVCMSEDGRIYPHCQQASAVLDVLRLAADAAGVITLCSCEVTGIDPSSCALTVRAGDTEETLPADRVILAAGGAAAPALGGSRSGWKLAAQLGHSCLPLAPGLAAVQCRLETAPAGEMADAKPIDLLPGLKGIRAQAAVTLLNGDTPLAVETGEVQFGDGTLSGIPVLQLSLLLPGLAAPRFALDLLPALQPQALCELLAARRAVPGVTLEELLLGTVHKKLGYALLKATGLAPLSRPAADLTDDELAAAAFVLKNLQITVTGTRGWDSAQTTVGGVPLSEVEPADCRSRKCAGLYLAGEVLDAAGRCGGYNLDWAFTTGRRAGKAAALSLA